MEKNEFNKELQRQFDNNNSIGLGELLLFANNPELYFDFEYHRDKCLNAIVDICGNYQTNARDFVKLISYEDFKKRRGISAPAALGLRILLLHQCGVDWLNPTMKVTGL